MLRNIEAEIKLFSAQFNENPPEFINYKKEITRWGKKKHLWAIGHKWEFKGQWYAVVHCGTWKDPNKNQRFTSWDANENMSKNFYAKAQAEQAVIERRLQIEKEEKHEECVKKWQPIFEKSIKTDHEYLRKKGILPYCAKVTESDALIIPLGKNPKNFTGAQQIYKDNEGKFQKRFTSGIDLKGSHCTLKDYRGFEYIYVGEGFATMASVQQAHPNIPCVAAMSAANLFYVIQEIRNINPKCKIVICADADPTDIGKKYARMCQTRLKNVIYKKPKFEPQNPLLTDFNDLHQAQGLNEVKKQLFIKPASFYSIVPLGVNENMYYYTTSENPQIVGLKAESHTKAGLRRLCANGDYWQANYGVEKDGEQVTNWDYAASDLMERCHHKGVHTPEDVRGIGIYPEKIENGETVFVINNGANAFNQPTNSNYYYIKKTPFRYEKGDHVPCLNFMGTLKNLPTKTKVGGLYLAASYVQSFIFPVLPWRFHLWLTGERGTGKSTVLEFLKRGGHFIELVQDTTPAGLRQNFASDQTAILYDEAEPSNEKIPAIINLARESSSNSGAKFLRGTAGGKAIHHNSQFNFLMSSIQIPTLGAADASRFLFVELIRNKHQSKEEFKTIQKEVALAERHSLDFFYFLSQNINYILAAREFARDYFLDKKVEARQADQLSTVVGCLSVLGINMYTPTQIVKMIVNQHDWLNTSYISESNLSDSENALQELLETVIDVRNHTTVEKGLYDWVNTTNADLSPCNDIKNALAMYGMFYYRKEHSLFVHHKNQNLINAMRNYPNFAQVIHRDTNIKTRKNVRQKINGVTKAGYYISLHKIIDEKPKIERK